MGAFELSVHTVWKVKAAVPVKRYDIGVEVGRYAAEMAVSIKRLDSLTNPKLFPDELLPLLC